MYFGFAIICTVVALKKSHFYVISSFYDLICITNILKLTFLLCTTLFQVQSRMGNVGPSERILFGNATLKKVWCPWHTKFGVLCLSQYGHIYWCARHT